ncbi:MAG: RNA polymerase sigma factor [Patescibacteria group bacterium]|jgi:RNA polymerase sigma-70 factor (ECF subfamily)
MEGNLEKTDEQVVKEILAGRLDDFGILVQRYEEKLKRYGWRFLSSPEGIEDIVQEVFISVYKNLKSFDLDKRFSPWIYRIAHNAYINALKKRSRDPLPFFDPDVLFPHPITPERPDRDLEKKEVRELLDKSLNMLPPKYREPLILFYLQELDYANIAEILHLPISTVGVRISRGRKMLQKNSNPSDYKL